MVVRSRLGSAGRTRTARRNRLTRAQSAKRLPIGELAWSPGAAERVYVALARNMSLFVINDDGSRLKRLGLGVSTAAALVGS